MRIQLKKDMAYAMTPMKILSWPVGTWPLQEYNVASASRCIFAISFLLLMVIMVHVEMYLDRSDSEKNLDAVVMISCGILAVLKMAWFRVRSAGLVFNFTSAVKDYNELDSDEKRAIMRRHAYMGRVAGTSVILFAYFSATLFATVSMLASDEEETSLNANETKGKSTNYPVPSECALQVLHVPDKLFLLIFILEYLMLLVTSNGNLGSDAVFFGITFHLCGQAELLKLDFTKIVNEEENTAKRIDALIKRHRHLLKLSEQLNDVISSVLIVQLFSSCLLICTTGFQFIFSLSELDGVMMIKTFMVMSTCLSQLFAYSYVGDYLTVQMEGIGYSFYSSSWYDLPRYLSRDIVLILLRSQRPVHLTAGKFIVVNMESYMSIMKTSMSYLSVLRVMITT
ncbi:odorant receptor 4-like [Andrena cerasifolii]|uniref:odorant receptor 4-like n=1 Tax=Andrena cerasifolii TaxID=2819439 RepID=UPI004037BF53